jgi:hypothetical protein
MNDSISTAESRYHHPLLRASIIIQSTSSSLNFASDSENSVVVCSPKNPTSIYPILLPVRTYESTLGTITVLRFIVISFSISHERIVSETVDHFGHLIISTASSAVIQIVSFEFIFRIISHFLSSLLLAGESLSIFIICMPF